jgi:hypothetical protein
MGPDFPPRNKFFRFKLKLNLFRLFFGLFHETKKINFSVCFGFSNLNRNKQTCFETNPEIRTTSTSSAGSWTRPGAAQNAL